MSHFGSLVKSSASLSVLVKMQQEIPVKSCAPGSSALCAGGCASLLFSSMPVEHRILHEQSGEAVTKCCTCAITAQSCSSLCHLTPHRILLWDRGKIFMYKHYYVPKRRRFKTSVFLSEWKVSLRYFCLESKIGNIRTGRYFHTLF